jgi:hypothetical protein
VGWDDSRGEHGDWKIKNSWGPTWGEQGFMWIARDSNDVAHLAEWVCAASLFYSLPQEMFTQLISDAKALPLVHYAGTAKSGLPDKMTTTIPSNVSTDAPVAQMTPFVPGMSN